MNLCGSSENDYSHENTEPIWCIVFDQTINESKIALQLRSPSMNGFLAVNPITIKLSKLLSKAVVYEPFEAPRRCTN